MWEKIYTAYVKILHSRLENWSIFIEKTSKKHVLRVTNANVPAARAKSDTKGKKTINFYRIIKKNIIFVTQLSDEKTL